MKVFSSQYLDDLTSAAENNPRKRQHRNIHQDYSEYCQRLFNAIEPDSYIRPHRHASDPKETLHKSPGFEVWRVEAYGRQSVSLLLAISAAFLPSFLIFAQTYPAASNAPLA